MLQETDTYISLKRPVIQESKLFQFPRTCIIAWLKLSAKTLIQQKVWYLFGVFFVSFNMDYMYVSQTINIQRLLATWTQLSELSLVSYVANKLDAGKVKHKVLQVPGDERVGIIVLDANRNRRSDFH